MLLTKKQKEQIDYAIKHNCADEVVNMMIEQFEKITKEQIETKIKQLNEQIANNNNQIEDKIRVSFINDIAVPLAFDNYYDDVDEYLEKLNSYLKELYANPNSVESFISKKLDKTKVNKDALKNIIEETKKDMKLDTSVAEQIHAITDKDKDAHCPPLTSEQIESLKITEKLTQIVEETKKNPELLKALKEQVTEKLREVTNEKKYFNFDLNTYSKKDVENYQKDKKKMEDLNLSDAKKSPDKYTYNIDVNKTYNVYTSDVNRKIVFNVPGFKKENIKISVIGNKLIVEGNKKSIIENYLLDHKLEYKGFSDLCTFKKEFDVQDNLDLTTIDSSLEDGLLYITIQIKQRETINIEIK